jgi:cyclophilin family peptidyl-prolyl cis-trans isomerase
MKKNRERQVRAARAAAARRQRRIRIISILVVLAVVLVLIASIVAGFGGGSSDKAASTTTTEVPTPCPAADGSSPKKVDFEHPQSTCIDPGKKYNAVFDTSEGRINVQLDTTKTPQTANNFVALARYHYYDGTQIFRTDPSIDIIQGGSPHTESASDQGPGYNIPDEGDGFKYTEGDLVMARGAGVNSASAQYFFGTGPNVAQLNGQGTYVTFGHAVEGLDVLKKIIALHAPTDDGLGGKPSHTVTVNTVTIIES